MSEYVHYDADTGKRIRVYDFDDCIRSIRFRYKNNEERIKHLEEENKKLREEHYKDNELQKIKQELDITKKHYRHGFPISENQQEAIELWQINHAEKAHGLKTADERMRAGGCIGGTWSYEFTPTSIGMIGKVKCYCGACFTFQNIE